MLHWEIIEVIASGAPWIAEWSVCRVGYITVAVGVDYVVSQRLQVVYWFQ